MPQGSEEQRDETLIDQLQKVVDALAADDPKTAAREIKPITFKPSEPLSRIQLTDREKARVWWRDSFVCRYCETRTVPSPVLFLINLAFPKEFPPWGKRHSEHPAWSTIMASCDHIQPVARGGDSKDLDNLATACWLCQARKRDFLLLELGWKIFPPAKVKWDGLASNYRQLCEAVRIPKVEAKYHQRWLTVFEETDPSRSGET